jgi:hypothetical protein
MIWRRARAVDLLRVLVHHHDLVDGLVKLRGHPFGVAEAILHVLSHLILAGSGVSVAQAGRVRGGCGAGRVLGGCSVQRASFAVVI